MNWKLLIVIGVVVVLLLAGGMAVGASRGKGQAGGDPEEWLQSLGDVLIRKKPLEAADILRADPFSCRQQFAAGAFTLQKDGACTLDVVESSSRFPVVRTLKVRLAQGQGAQLAWDPAGEAQLTERASLKPSEAEASVDIFKEGGTLSLSCQAVASGVCRVSVQREP